MEHKKITPKKAGFDLIIIGGGAGAFAAAIRASDLKAKTAIINTGLPLGGTCVNVGCVPSKTLLYAGEILHHAKHHDVAGVELEVKNFDFQKVVQDELSLVEKLRQEKYEKVLKNLEYVTLIEGKAKFVSHDEVEIISGRNPAPQRVRGKKFIIAAGSTANVPEIEGIKEVGFVTHIEALRLEKQPKELVIIGAGPLGLEFAQLFSRFGTKVTVLQRGNSIFPHSEKTLTDRLAEVLSKEGITIKTNVEVKSTRKENGKKIISYLVNGKSEEVSGDEILLAAGKTPNTQGLGLDVVGIEINKQQAVVVNQYFQTSNKNIFAVGDVTSAPMRLETTAGREGTLAAENALKGTQLFVDYNTVPYAVFTDPQLAGVGFTEDDQIHPALYLGKGGVKQMGVCACPVRDDSNISPIERGASNDACTLVGPMGQIFSNGACRTVSFEDVPKAIIMRQTLGMIKMAIHPKTKQILGVHILGAQASELIAEAMMLIKNKNTIDDVVNSLPMFPTLSEAIKIVALSFTKDISKLSCCI